MSLSKQFILLVTFIISAPHVFGYTASLEDQVYEELKTKCGLIDVKYSDISYDILESEYDYDHQDHWIAGFSLEVAYLYKDELVALAYVAGVTADDEEDIIDEAYINEFSCPKK